MTAGAQQQEVAIVIPVYRPDVSYNERISLERMGETLAPYPKILVAPIGMDTSEYRAIVPDLEFALFHPHHFQGDSAYNKMMMSKEFYGRFLDYRYILIHQLDVFVFNDSLLEWCDLGYDYVGAPWVDEKWIESLIRTASLIRRFVPPWRNRLNNYVGNGGFSLRKVKPHYRNLVCWQGKAQRWHVEHEDIFWSLYLPSYNPFFRIAPFELALRFAFESSPSKCYEMNGRRMPFGCHAWEKFEPEFWRPHFARAGYVV